MNFRKTTIAFSFFLLLIILFDAFQQYYYLTNFDIVENRSEILFTNLFQTHFIRWLVWAASAIPLSLFSWKIFSNTKMDIPVSTWLKIFIAGFLCWILAIVSISLISISGISFSINGFSETLLFFTVQKGITFLFAYCVLVLILFNKSKEQVIDAQWLEIKNLKTDSSASGTQNLNPQVSIKIGNRVKLISLNEVTWIESDDYCVKIHTQHKSYSLRKSLKSLEEQLAPFQFVRVHRGALLNLGYLDQVDFEQSVIKLQDSSELPLSKSGAQVLRKTLKASSI